MDAQGGTSAPRAALLRARATTPAQPAQAPASATDGDGSTPLQWAVYDGNVKEVTRLVEQGADVHARDAHGLTALDYSLARARIGFLQQQPPVRNDLAKLLKDLGAHVESPNLPPWPSVPTPTITAQVPD